MSPVLFVNLPVKDLDKSKAFFTDLGLTFFGMAEDMASVVINEHAQVMLLTEPTFATYAGTEVADATKSTQVILVMGVETLPRSTSCSTRPSRRVAPPSAI